LAYTAWLWLTYYSISPLWAYFFRGRPLHGGEVVLLLVTGVYSWLVGTV
jgi:hypothetical protein